ncbi:MAG: hypothetical protein IJK42_04405 [Prevotella sp.]|nr:hypothetical protein [Prevotella sp.]
MKAYTIKLLLAALCLCGATESLAQSAFYVYRTDGAINQFVYSDILSIEYGMEDIDGTGIEEYVQVINTIDSVCSIPVAKIDSVSFVTPTPALSISSAYVPLDPEETEVVDCDPEEGKYTLSFTGDLPPIDEGSVIIVDADSVSYIVLVTDVNIVGNRYEIEGEQGDLSYIFYDTEFTLSTEELRNGAADVDHLYKPTLAPRRKAVEIDDGVVRATGPLWSNNGEEQTTDIYKKGSTHAYSKHKFALNLDYEVTLLFGDKQEVEKRGKSFFKACNFGVDGNIKGNMDAYYDLYIDVEKEETEFDLKPEGNDKYVLLKHKLFPTIPIKFSIGPVPVTIDLGTDLFADVSLKGQGEFHFSSGIGADASAMIGARYNTADEGSVQMYYEQPSFHVTPHDPTISGKGKLSGKVHLFPRIHAWLYGLAGPSFDIKPFLRADLSGGFKKDLLQSAPSDYCAWALKTYCGLDLAVGLSRSRMNYEVWNKSTDDLTAFEYNLYESPVNIKFRSASPDKVVKDQTTEVSFEVYDKGFDGEEVLTILPQLVKFEGDGDIQSTAGAYGVVSSGVAKASWTPSSSKDVLYARLYDIDGNVIAEDKYEGKGDITCPDENHPHWIDLGLPSGTQWRCCNEGASTPEAFGGYYTFGQVASAPTIEQIKEFLNNTTSVWTTQNGVRGRKFTSKINGGTVFLPAAGARWYGSLISVGTYGYYWSSTPNDEGDAYELYFDSYDAYWNYWDGNRYGGPSVRPVR